MPNRFIHWTAAAALLLSLASHRATAAPIEFVALGDQPYGHDVRTGPPYRSLIAQINGLKLKFAIHVGDFKDGLTECSDALYDRQLAHFASFAGALIYTPGDNDWADCQRQSTDPIERLQALRLRFFKGSGSMGQRPISLQRQAELMPAHRAFVENQRWWHERVLFVTFHTVGPDDNTEAASAALRAEQRLREAANVAWIRDAFTVARERGARALVLATQADVVRRGDSLTQPPQLHPAFARSFGDILLPASQTAPFPVLLIHGDSHRFITDQPFLDAQGQRIRNLWRLQVPGESRMHAVRVRIEPGSATPFGFSLIWNPMSPVPQ